MYFFCTENQLEVFHGEEVLFLKDFFDGGKNFSANLSGWLSTCANDVLKNFQIVKRFLSSREVLKISIKKVPQRCEEFSLRAQRHFLRKRKFS